MWFIGNKLMQRTAIITRLQETRRIDKVKRCLLSYKNIKKDKRLHALLLIGSVASGGLLYVYRQKRVVDGYEKGNENLSKQYTLEDVARHYSKDTGIWVSYKDGVYDITDFVDKHPGGENIMMGAGSAIDPFWKTYEFHKTSEILEMLEQYRIGSLIKDTVADKMEDDDPYGNEPKRSKLLKVNSEKPFNAEPPGPLLVKSFITSEDTFYVRNHLPVPVVDESTYMLEVGGLGISAHTFSLEELKKLFSKVTVTATIQCAGNRRSEMAKIKPVKGLNWDSSAIGNATWTGVPLREVLMYCGLRDLSNLKHVQFDGLDTNPAGASYGASIPIEKALDATGDVILAYEMNGKPLPIDHGFPLRVIVPGVVGARNVKWLGRITVSDVESDSFWQQNDYKGFSPSVDWDTVDFKSAPSIQELPVVSAICDPVNGQRVKPENGKITVKGYAWSGGGKKIVRVDITSNEGKDWRTADIVCQDEDASLTKCWSWVLWKTDIPVSEDTKEVQIWAKAVDSSYNTQPESFEYIWNLRGVLGNAFHRINIYIDSLK